MKLYQQKGMFELLHDAIHQERWSSVECLTDILLDWYADKGEDNRHKQ